MGSLESWERWASISCIRAGDGAMGSWIADRFLLPLALAVVRKYSCSLQVQSIFMMQPTEDRVSYNLKVHIVKLTMATMHMA